ncbi:MAG: hypothetical protein ACI4JV_01425 [Ruminiclostridium sp.]
MNTQERKTVRKALNRVERFIKDFQLIDYKKYEQLIDFLNSIDSRLPERESRLIMNYCSEVLNPKNGIFEFPDIVKSADLRGNDYTVISGREEEFLARVESAYLYVIGKFCELEKMCA